VSKEIECKYVAGNIHGAYELLRGWYRKRGSQPQKPTRKELDKIREEFLKLYQKETPLGDPIPIHVFPLPINDKIPDEDEVWTAAKRMHCGKSPGASGICVSDLLYWHERLPEVWEKLVCLVQDCFEGKAIPQEFSYEILCLIPNLEQGKYCRIALLDVIYKLVSMIIHIRIQDAIQFHPALHGFQHSHGTGTCILEAKLQMQLASYLCQPLYQIFLDLSKAYDTLDRDRTLSILEAYGAGPHICSIIHMVWNAKLVLPSSGGYYGEPFHAWRGVRQGDIISPIIFNIVIDAIVREWYACMDIGTVNEGGLRTTFYADDGCLAGTDPEQLQQGFTLVIDLLKRMGLHLNVNKTKAMVYFGGAGSRHMSTEAYAHRFDKSLSTQ
jgi:hypothetical protein